MDSERVREIMQSNGVLEVRYNNEQVWLHQLHGDMVEIEYLDRFKRTFVPVGDLMEPD